MAGSIMSEMEELQRRLAEVEAREQELARRESALAAKAVHRNPYERLNLSEKAVNAVIIVCILAIAALIAFGLYLGKTP